MDTDKTEQGTDAVDNSTESTENAAETAAPFPALAFAGEPYRTVKDSVFKRLFTEPTYLLQLYQALHPEDTETTAENLHIVTLETVIIKDIHNDLGFSVGDKLVILAEAQSTWSVNIIIRCLFYLAHTYQSYFRERKKSLYSETPVEMPRAELYVIYTGPKNIDKTEISLTDEFFGGIPCAIDTRVKVITETGSHDIINQYIVFCKVFDAQRKVCKTTVEAIRETIRICKDSDILKEFLEQHEREAVDIMEQLYSQREVVTEWGESQREEGIEEGLVKGRAEGRAEEHIDTLLSVIKNIEENMGVSSGKAMDILGVSESDRKALMPRLQ